MHVINAIPISAGAPRGSLSYFSAKPLTVGSFIEIKLKNKGVLGVVSHSKDALTEKTNLRKATFGLRKISGILPGECPNWLLASARELAVYFAAPTGAILNSLLPKTLIPLYLKPKNSAGEKLIASENVIPEKLALEASEEDRLGHYKILIREAFARKESVLISCQSNEAVGVFFKKLSLGIERHAIAVTGELRKSQWVEIASKIAQPDPLLIVCTPPYILIPRPDIKTIILDREAAPSYRQIQRPFLNIRTVAAVLAKHRHLKLIFADRLLSLETQKEILEGDISRLASISSRAGVAPNRKIIDMTKEPREKTGEPVITLSRPLRSLAETANRRGGHLFIFAVRRGLASLTLCGDCGQVVTCGKCSAPVVLHDQRNDEKSRYFICHRCGERHTAAKRCRVCGSWRLNALGVGSERVFDDLRKILPDAPVFLLDSDSAKTSAAARKIIKEFYDTAGGILVGTEKALTYLSERVNHVAVSSLDSLFAIPDFRMNEKIASLILALEELAESTLMIQTRNGNYPLLNLSSTTKEVLNQFIRKELEERHSLGYPPYKTFIKITATTRPEDAGKETAKLKNLFSPWNPRIYQGFTPIIKSRAVLNCLISLKPENWPYKKLSKLLLTLPPSFRVDVDPENLL